MPSLLSPAALEPVAPLAWLCMPLPHGHVTVSPLGCSRAALRRLGRLSGPLGIELQQSLQDRVVTAWIPGTLSACLTVPGLHGYCRHALPQQQFAHNAHLTPCIRKRDLTAQQTCLPQTDRAVVLRLAGLVTIGAGTRTPWGEVPPEDPPCWSSSSLAHNSSGP